MRTNSAAHIRPLDVRIALAALAIVAAAAGPAVAFAEATHPAKTTVSADPNDPPIPNPPSPVAPAPAAPQVEYNWQDYMGSGGGGGG